MDAVQIAPRMGKFKPSKGLDPDLQWARAHLMAKILNAGGVLPICLKVEKTLRELQNKIDRAPQVQIVWSRYRARKDLWRRALLSAILSSMIGRRSGLIVSERDSSRLIEASLLQDIGLAHMPPDWVPDGLKWTFGLAERFIFWSHPGRGSDLARMIPGVHASVVAAIDQHHEKWSGEGFPMGTLVRQIHPHAEIIGISMDGVACLESHSSNLPIEFKKSINSSDYRRSVYDAFCWTMTGE